MNTTAVTEKALRKVSRKEMLGALSMTGMMPEKPVKKTACAFVVSRQAATALAKLFRDAGIVTCYDRNSVPAKLVVLKEDRAKAVGILDGAKAEYFEE